MQPRFASTQQSFQNRYLHSSGASLRKEKPLELSITLNNDGGTNGAAFVDDMGAEEIEGLYGLKRDSKSTKPKNKKRITISAEASGARVMHMVSDDDEEETTEAREAKTGTVVVRMKGMKRKAQAAAVLAKKMSDKDITAAKE